MKRGANSFVAPLVDAAGWDGGWVAFVDKTRLQTYNASADGVVSTQQPVPSGIAVTGNNTASGATPYIMFDASGFSRTKGGGFGALALQVRRTDVPAAEQFDQTRVVIVSSTGRVRVCKPVSASDTNCQANSTE